MTQLLLYKCRQLGGPEAPESWRGDLNVTYSLGPNFKDPIVYIEMNILTENKMAETYNAIGILLGEEEPGMDDIVLKTSFTSPLQVNP